MTATNAGGAVVADPITLALAEHLDFSAERLAKLTIEEATAIERQIDALRSWYTANPLAAWRAWDSPRTSQKAAFKGFGRDITLFLGGNRSGKLRGQGQYRSPLPLVPTIR